MNATDTRTLTPGTWVFCTVRLPYPSVGCLGWFRVLAVRPRDGYIKLDGGGKAWCPPHNFSLTDLNGKNFLGEPA